MAWERLLRAWTEDKHVVLEGRVLSQRLQEGYRRELQALRRIRLERNGHPRMVEENLRNRVVIQEMKRVYDQLAGVGDCLLGANLSKVLPEGDRLSRLERSDLEALNIQVAMLATKIFGPELAEVALDRIDRVIKHVFEQ